MEVEVRNNNVEKALRVLKKKLQKDGLFRELRLKQFYEKPSEKKLRKKQESLRRIAKEKRLKRLKRMKSYSYSNTVVQVFIIGSVKI